MSFVLESFRFRLYLVRLGFFFGNSGSLERRIGLHELDEKQSKINQEKSINLLSGIDFKHGPTWIIKR